MANPITITNLSITGRAQALDPNFENVSASYDADFSGPSAYVFDLTVLNQQKVFGIPRSIFIDNGSNPNQLTVSVSITQQYFIVPAYAAGNFTLSASVASAVTIESDGGATDTVTLAIFNYDVPPVVWYSFGTFNLDKPLSVFGTMGEGDNIAASTNNNAVYMGGKSPTGTFEPIAVSATGKFQLDDSTPIDVDIPGDLTTLPAALPTSSISSVTASVASVTLVATNANRKGLFLHNNSANAANVAFDNVDAAVSYSVIIAANSSFTLPFNYTGQVNGVWSVAAGDMLITEFE